MRFPTQVIGSNYARVGFEAAGGAVPENGYVSAGAGSDGSADRAVRFAGGSRIQFAPGSRGRISDSKVATPRVVLEAGRATVRGDANPREDLLVEAGPYAMKSDGGAFDVSWSGSVLEIRVASGAVVVEGPVARHGMTLYGDQASSPAKPTEKSDASERALSAGLRVAVVRTVGAASLVGEATTRLGAVLLAAGFDIVELDARTEADARGATHPESWRELAQRGARIVAVLALHAASSGVEIDVAVCDLTTRKTSARRVTAPVRSWEASPENSRDVALQGLELLRAGLSEADSWSACGSGAPERVDVRDSRVVRRNVSPETAHRGRRATPRTRAGCRGAITQSKWLQVT